MTRSRPATADHDHAACRREALQTAQRVCDQRGLALTPIRRKVLDIIWTSHAPIGAYEILGRLPRSARAPAPMTVYRALEFLVSAGLIHRLDSLNAFVGCPRADDVHAPQLLVCRLCQRVEEITDPAVSRAVGRAASRHGFSVDVPVEVKGLCTDCRMAAAVTSPRPPRR
jgi:Fur family zinc uptake transcriptional regulator